MVWRSSDHLDADETDACSCREKGGRFIPTDSMPNGTHFFPGGSLSCATLSTPLSVLGSLVGQDRKHLNRAVHAPTTSHLDQHAIQNQSVRIPMRERIFP